MQLRRWALIAFAIGSASAYAITNSGEILSRIHSINEEEISAGQLASKKATAKQVHDYAERMIRDHSSADQKVLSVAKAENLKISKQLPNSTAEAGKVVKHAAQNAQLKTMEAGADFDKAYVEAMIKGHDDAIHMLEGSNPDNLAVKSLVRTLLPEIKMHRSMAAKLLPEVQRLAQ